MDLSNYQKMDVFILFSCVNMKLRDEYPSLTELCKSLDLDMDILKDRLKQAGFEYDEAQNQFK